MPIRPRIDAMSGPTILWMAPNPDSLLRRDMWREGTLTGNSKLDGRQQQKITEHLRAILSDTLHDGGLRVRLEQTSRYANLIFLFDLMMRQNVKKGYWLDITRSPTTFYVITKAHKPPDPSLTVLPNCCGLGDDVGHYTPPPPPPTPFWIRFDDAVTKFWRFAWLKFPQELQQPEWRVSVWLLTAIVGLSGWRVIQAWGMA
ncbi:hypothetical protein GCM10027511_09650 [Hymenobacter humi]